MTPQKILTALQAYVKASEQGVARIRDVRTAFDPQQVTFVDLLQKIRRELQLNPNIKGDKGERGFTGETGPKGEQGERGEKGDAGPQGTDGLVGKDGRDGKDGKDGLDGKDGNANITEVIGVAQNEVRTHEASFDHALLHDSLVLGSKVIDEANVGEGKVLQVQGKKLVYKPLPKAGPAQQIHGGGPSIVRKNSTGSDFNRRRINLIEGSNITITVADDPDNLETDITITGAASGGIQFADREVPSGSVNGVNATFTLAHTPTVGSELLFRNGVLQNSIGGSDYSISGLTITFAVAPEDGDALLVSYRY